MLSNILGYIIADTFTKECPIVPEGNWIRIRRKALRIQWNHFDPTIDNDYLKTEMVLWGESNYIGVYVRSYCVHGTPTGKEEWKVLTHHDSTWRSEIDHWIFENRESLSTVGDLFKSWAEVFEIDDELKKTFKEVRHNKYNHNL